MTTKVISLVQEEDWILSPQKREVERRLALQNLVAEANGSPSLVHSIAWHLEHLTDAEVARFCAETKLAPMTAEEFRVQWDDETWDGLAALLYIRREEQR